MADRPGSYATKKILLDPAKRLQAPGGEEDQAAIRAEKIRPDGRLLGDLPLKTSG